jgi:hypothetical protein
MDFDQGSEMIIFEVILTSFEASSIFLRQLGKKQKVA